MHCCSRISMLSKYNMYLDTLIFFHIKLLANIQFTGISSCGHFHVSLFTPVLMNWLALLSL